MCGPSSRKAAEARHQLKFWNRPTFRRMLTKRAPLKLFPSLHPVCETRQTTSRQVIFSFVTICVLCCHNVSFSAAINAARGQCCQAKCLENCGTKTICFHITGGQEEELEELSSEMGSRLGSGILVQHKSDLCRRATTYATTLHFVFHNRLTFDIAALHVQPPPQFSDDDLPTVEAVVAQKRKEAEERIAKVGAVSETETTAPVAPSAEVNAEVPVQESEAGAPRSDALSGPEALEAEAGQQGAFNPETGEINWDCPCLGGMADGPCGVEFKAAFSCFVYSKEEPKGMECIDKFQYVMVSTEGALITLLTQV